MILVCLCGGVTNTNQKEGVTLCRFCFKALWDSSKRDRINSYAKAIGALVPRLETGGGGEGVEIHELAQLVRHLNEELR